MLQSLNYLIGLLWSVVYKHVGPVSGSTGVFEIKKEVPNFTPHPEQPPGESRRRTLLRDEHPVG